MEKFKKEIAKELGGKPSQIFLYWKGRNGLFALLKSIGVKEGDEIIIPAFTCVVVPNAIVYLGAKPVYVDINKDTLNTGLSQIKAKVTENTKCILIQNTFGLSSETEEIVAFAQQKNIFTIEDCTHGFGGKHQGKPNGTFADASFFSTQWNKPFSTGVGGFVYLKTDKYKESITQVNNELVMPSIKEKTILRILITARKWFLTPRTYWFLLKAYRYLSKKGIVVGSSTGEEITSVTMPKNYFKGFSKVQAKEGVKGIKSLPEVLRRRKENGLLFNQFLKENDKTIVKEVYHVNHSFLKYPILVKDRKRFMEKAENSSISLGDWFISMIHPITKDFEKWGLDIHEYPIAKNVSEKILNLDTDTKHPKEVLDFLKKNINDIL